MAKVIWHSNAQSMLDYHIEYALAEFGKKTALRWRREIEAFEEQMKKYPESYTPEALLRGKPVLYRSRHLMNRRFKLIHYYNESTDTVHVVDIWDTRMNPSKLIKRIN